MRQTIQNANASLYLDGNAGYLTVPITPAPTGFNFGAWIKTGKRTASSTTILISSNSAAFTDGFYLGRGNGRGDFEFVGYNSTNSVSTSLRTGNVSDGVWAHVAVTYLPSGVCNIYLNGVLANTVTATNTITTGTTSIYVGKRSYNATFAGLNANNLVWHNTTTPWTAAQVLALYQSGTVPTGATAVYPLSEGAGTVAYDTSGNGNNGTITSGTWSRDTPTKTRKLVNKNLVYNGDFEIAPVVNVAQTTGSNWLDGTAAGSSTNTVFGWRPSVTAGTFEGYLDSTVKKSGNYSLKLTTSAGGYTEYWCASTTTKIGLIPVLPSTSYTISGWMKTEYISGSSTAGARFFVNTYTGAASYIATPGLTTVVNTTTDWTYYSHTFTTSSDARFAIAIPSIRGNSGTATLAMTAWFDDIQLYPTTPVTRSAATGRLAATGRSAA